MYYTVIKHSGHLRTLEKCRKHSPAARVVYIFLVFSNARRVLSQCNTRLRLLYLLSILLLLLLLLLLLFHNKSTNWEKNLFSAIFQGRGSLYNSCRKTFSSVRSFITGEILPFLLLMGRTIFFILIDHI